MKDWWNNLSLREKQGVAAAAGFILLFLLYSILWLPLANKTDLLRKQIVKNKNLLAWMQSADQQINVLTQFSQKHTVNHQGSVLGIVQTELTKADLAAHVTQLKQAESDGVRLQLQKISFDELIGWLIHLWQQDRLTVSQAAIVPGDAIGLVSAELVLTREE